MLNDCNINYRWNVDEVGYKFTLYNTWVLILSKISTNYSYKGFRINKNYDTVTTDVHSTMSRQINILFQFIKIIWTSTYLIYKCNMQDTIAGLEINTRQKSYTLCSLWHMYYYFNIYVIESRSDKMSRWIRHAQTNYSTILRRKKIQELINHY